VRLIELSTEKTLVLNLNNTAAFYSKLFSFQKIEEIFSKIHGSKTEFLDQSKANKFNAFIFKNFSRLGSISTIQQSENDYCIFNSCITTAVHLEELDLSYQAIKVIPSEISKLTKL